MTPPPPPVVVRTTPPRPVVLDAAGMLRAMTTTAPDGDGLVRINTGAGTCTMNPADRADLVKRARAVLSDRKWTEPDVQHTPPARCIGDFRTLTRKDATIEALEHNVREAEAHGNPALVRVMREALERAKRIYPVL